MSKRKTLTDEQVKVFTDQFKNNSVKKDGNDCISCDQLVKIMRNIGQNPTNKLIDQLTEDCCAEGEDEPEELDYGEYMTFMNLHFQPFSKVKALLEDAFKAFDTNGDGNISVEELVKATKMQPSEVKEIVREFDTNGDNQLNYKEFSKFLLDEDMLQAVYGKDVL